MANRAVDFAKAPEPGLLGGVVPVAFGRNAMLTNYIRRGTDLHRMSEPRRGVWLRLLRAG